MFLGIDTSCYTTSLCLLDEKGHLKADIRRLLEVRPGGRGLRQSEMVFQHNRNLPELWRQAWELAGTDVRLSAIGVSVAPRTRIDSYMPAFRVGAGYAQVVSLCQRIPLYSFSHQENHVCAGLWSAQGPSEPEFLAFHLSGGTTELLQIRRREDQELDVVLLGGSLDLHAGQFVDRIGVLLDLDFPAGPALERLAATSGSLAEPFPVAVKGMDVSFAGPENHAKKMIGRQQPSPEIAAGVQHCIARSVTKVLQKGMQTTGLKQILLVGGVMSNQFIRRYLIDQLEPGGARLFFPEPVYSSDNAVGAAYYALQSQARKPV